MAACDDCIHYELCFDDNITQFDKGNAEQCTYFKDASKLVELPCKVGDTLYYICENRVEDDKVHSMYVDCWSNISIKLKWVRGRVNSSEIGKTVFLTKEEAEKALKEREQE